MKVLHKLTLLKYDIINKFKFKFRIQINYTFIHKNIKLIAYFLLF